MKAIEEIADVARRNEDSAGKFQDATQSLVKEADHLRILAENFSV